jgi:hypothetical protein
VETGLSEHLEGVVVADSTRAMVGSSGSIRSYRFLEVNRWAVSANEYLE